MPLKLVICYTGHRHNVSSTSNTTRRTMLENTFQFSAQQLQKTLTTRQGSGGESGEECAVSGCQWQQLTGKQTNGRTDGRTKATAGSLWQCCEAPYCVCYNFRSVVCGTGNSAYE